MSKPPITPRAYERADIAYSNALFELDQLLESTALDDHERIAKIAERIAFAARHLAAADKILGTERVQEIMASYTDDPTSSWAVAVTHSVDT